MKVVIVMIAAVLSGCALTKVPEPVYVPLPVPCKIEEPTQPEFRYSPPYNHIYEAVTDLIGDRVLAEAYQKELKAALNACR